MNYILDPFLNVFDIKGKASQKEFWIFFAFIILIISPILGIVRAKFDIDRNIILIVRFLYLIPFLTLGFRRLNETQFSKWLFLIPFVNIILAGFPSETAHDK